MYTLVLAPGALVNDESGKLAKATDRPDLYAKSLRDLFEPNIKKTEKDYFDDRFNDAGVNAYYICVSLADNTNCGADLADELCQEYFPELWANYWEGIFGF